jgi:hypothetical protein
VKTLMRSYEGMLLLAAKGAYLATSPLEIKFWLNLYLGN